MHLLAPEITSTFSLFRLRNKLITQRRSNLTTLWQNDIETLFNKLFPAPPCRIICIPLRAWSWCHSLTVCMCSSPMVWLPVTLHCCLPTYRTATERIHKETKADGVKNGFKVRIFEYLGVSPGGLRAFGVRHPWPVAFLLHGSVFAAVNCPKAREPICWDVQSTVDRFTDALHTGMDAAEFTAPGLRD